MFAFIDEEGQKSEKSTTDSQSNEDPADFKKLGNNTRQIPELQRTGHFSGRSPTPGDLAWDNYDTSRPIVHDFDEHGYAEPSIEDPSPAHISPSRSSRRQDVDKAYLIDNIETII